MNMFRNLFALFSTLMLGTGAGSVPTAASTDLPLEQRVQSAQNTIGKLMDAAEEPSPRADSYRVAKDTKSQTSPGANNPSGAAWHNWTNFGAKQPTNSGTATGKVKPGNAWHNWTNF
jgi:hypothetical protein